MCVDLLDLARRVATVYGSTGKVAAVVAAGSVGRGLADGYSDLDLDVYWSRRPSDGDRLGVISAVGGRLEQLWPYEPAEGEWAETYHVEGVQVGISGYVTDWLASCIEDVVERGDPDLFKQMRLAALNDGMTVYGEIIVRLWRSRSRTYPDVLATAVVTEYLNPARLERFRQRRALIARDDLVALRACLPGVTDMILGALCAINRILIQDPEFKWCAQLIDRFRVAPADLRDRLWAVANGPAVAAATILEDVLDEVLTIVDNELPGTPLHHLRQALAGGRLSNRVTLSENT